MIEEDPEIGLRHYLERIIDERHRLYEQRFKEAEQRTELALSAMRTNRSQSEWSTGTIIAAVLGIMGLLISLVVIFLKH